MSTHGLVICIVTLTGAAAHADKQYLILPGDGDTARDKLAVEGGICGVQVDASHRGELLDVHDVLTINRMRLHTENKEVPAVRSLGHWVSLTTKDTAHGVEACTLPPVLVVPSLSFEAF